MTRTTTRVERDTFGPIEVPADRLWGAQTQRSLEHFRISTEKMPPALIRALLIVKRSAVLALAARDGEVARQLWALTANELEQLQHHILVLGCMNAKEHVANFRWGRDRIANVPPGHCGLSRVDNRDGVADDKPA